MGKEIGNGGGGRERWKIEFLELSVKSIDGRPPCARAAPPQVCPPALPSSLSLSSLSKIKDPPSAVSSMMDFGVQARIARCSTDRIQ